MSAHLLEKRETKTEEQSSTLLRDPGVLSRCTLYLILKSRKRSHTSHSMIKEAKLKAKDTYLLIGCRVTWIKKTPQTVCRTHFLLISLSLKMICTLFTRQHLLKGFCKRLAIMHHNNLQIYNISTYNSPPGLVNGKLKNGDKG